MIKFVLDNVGTADIKCILIRCNLLRYIYVHISQQNIVTVDFFGGAALHSLWGFSSSTRDQTQAFNSESTES